MKYFVGILKQFTQSQKLIVLILLLTFTSGSVLISQYLKTDDCRPIIDENLKMQEDFAKILSMLREQRMASANEMKVEIQDTIKVTEYPDGKKIETTIRHVDNNPVLEEIYKIAQSNTKK